MLANKNTSGNPPYKFSNADSNSSLFLGPTKTENYPTKSYIIKSSDISHGKSGGPNPLPLEKPNYPDIDMAISGFPTTGNRNVPGTTTTTPVFVKRDPGICSPEVLQSETKIINPVSGTGASSLTDPLMEDESSIDVSTLETLIIVLNYYLFLEISSNRTSLFQSELLLIFELFFFRMIISN